jgi:transcriptional regulator with XRE-family HTH domain
MASEFTKRIAARIRAVVGRKTPVDLTEHDGPSRSYIYRLMKGEANPTVEQLDAICRAYGTTLAEFFEPWSRESAVKRLADAAEARLRLEQIIAQPELSLDGVLLILRHLTSDDTRRSSKSK